MRFATACFARIMREDRDRRTAPAIGALIIREYRLALGNLPASSFPMAQGPADSFHAHGLLQNSEALNHSESF
jgi:hypothetical protein